MIVDCTHMGLVSLSMRALRLGSVCLKRDLDMPRPEYCRS